MPRPKRRKIAASAPVSHSAKDLAKKTTIASTANGQKPAQQRTQRSDDRAAERSPGLKRPVRLTRQGRAGMGEGVYMSGALAHGDQHDAEISTTPADLVLVPSTAEEPREEVAKPVGKETVKIPARSNSITTSTPLNPGNFQRRTRPASILGRTQSDAEESDIEVGRGLLGSTPGIRSSVLALDKFKRRPRQSSILAMGRSEQSMSDGEINLSLDDSFNPEDESTPFHIAKTRPQSAMSKPAATPSGQSIPRKRKITSVAPPSSPPTPQDMPIRSRDEDLYDVSDSSPNYTRSKPRNHQRIINPLSPTMAPPLSSSPITSPSREIQRPLIIELTSQHHQSPSSRPRAIPTDTETTIHTSPVPKSTMHRRAAKSKAAPKRTSMSTADLQSLLPKRRRHSVLRSGGRGMTPVNAFAIPSSSDIDDSAGLLASPSSSEPEDDLPGHTVAKMKHANSTKKPAKVPKQAPPSKSSRHISTSIRGTSKRPSTTYSTARRGSSDKENASFANDSLDPTAADDDDIDEDEMAATAVVTTKSTRGHKLSRVPQKTYGAAAKKFKEVDEWALEFEDISQRTLDSSPWDAR
jgi:hypothetical protein